jgi:hypothetical protein
MHWWWDRGKIIDALDQLLLNGWRMEKSEKWVNIVEKDLPKLEYLDGKG